MALLVAIIVGLIVAVLFSALHGRFDNLPAYGLLGVAGAIIGDALYFIATDNYSLLFAWGGVACQAIGAVILILLIDMLRMLVSGIHKKTDSM